MSNTHRKAMARLSLTRIEETIFSPRFYPLSALSRLFIVLCSIRLNGALPVHEYEESFFEAWAKTMPFDTITDHAEEASIRDLSLGEMQREGVISFPRDGGFVIDVSSEAYEESLHDD